MELIKLLSNPIRIRVMQYLQTHNEATTKQIAEALQDIPAPTLYRHINALLNEDILIVKEERKVRGSLERILAINKVKLANAEQGNVADTAYQFLMELYSKFQRYSCKADADPVKDRLSMRTCILSLTDDKFDDFMHEIGAVIEKYQQNDTNRNEKTRSISFISAPVEEVGK